VELYLLLTIHYILPNYSTMNSSQVLPIALAFAIGGGLVFALKPGGDNKESEDKLAAAEKRIAELEARTAPKISAIAPEPIDTSKGAPITALLDDSAPVEEEDKPATAEEQMAKLFNSPEARNLMKGFAGAMSGRADQWIDGEMKKYKEKLGLTDAQMESIKGKMLAMVEENTESFQSALDDSSKSMQEIMESQGQFWRDNETEVEAMLKDELTDDQFADFEREQLVEKTKTVQRQADWELRRIDDAVELSETQEDQVFNILVRQSNDYDPAMAIEGADADLPPGATAAEVTKEDAIRSVLTPEQTETYNGKVESGGFGRRRGPFGGGGSPFGGGR